MKRLSMVGILAFVSVPVLFAVQLAGRKLFWGDETTGIAVSCVDSFGTLLFHGATSQCSPQPLYYLLQKLLYHAHLIPLDHHVLVMTRLVSLASAAVLLVLLTATIRQVFGWAPALFGLTLMTTQPLFFKFAAEDRPYMFWLLLFCAMTFAHRLLITSLEGGSWKGLAAFGVSCIALAFCTNAGAVQAASAIGSLFWVGWSLRILSRTKALQLLTLGVAVSCIALFYASDICSERNDYNLIVSQDWRLLAGVGRLLFPKGSWLTFALNGVVGLGILVSLRDKKSLPFTLQLGVAGIIGLLIAFFQYYFVQRMFIFLLPLQAWFGAKGCHWLQARICSGAPTRWIWTATAGALLIHGFYGIDQHLFESFPPLTPPEIPCEMAERRVTPWRREEDDHTRVLNKSMLLGLALTRCRSSREFKRNEIPLRVLVQADSSAVTPLADGAIQEGAPVEMCGFRLEL